MDFFKSPEFMEMKILARSACCKYKFEVGDNVDKNLEILKNEGFRIEQGYVYWNTITTKMAKFLYDEYKHAETKLYEQIDIIKKAVYDGKNGCELIIAEDLIPVLRDRINKPLTITQTSVFWEINSI